MFNNSIMVLFYISHLHKVWNSIAMGVAREGPGAQYPNLKSEKKLSSLKENRRTIRIVLS